MLKNWLFILIVVFFSFSNSAQDLGGERAFDIYKKPLLISFFEEPYYPAPREELVSTKNMYSKKPVKQEIDMVYEMQRKEARKEELSQKYQSSVDRFRNKFNVNSRNDAKPRLRGQTDVRQVHPFHDPYMMSPRAYMMNPVYRSSLMRPGMYSTYGYGTQVETSFNKKEEEKEKQD